MLAHSALRKLVSKTAKCLALHKLQFMDCTYPVTSFAFLVTTLSHTEMKRKHISHLSCLPNPA